MESAGRKYIGREIGTQTNRILIKFEKMAWKMLWRNGKIPTQIEIWCNMNWFEIVVGLKFVLVCNILCRVRNHQNISYMFWWFRTRHEIKYLAYKMLNLLWIWFVHALVARRTSGETDESYCCYRFKNTCRHRTWERETCVLLPTFVSTFELIFWQYFAKTTNQWTPDIN